MDWLKTATDVGTFASALVVAVAIVVAMRTYKRQTNARVFLEYTSRYEAMMALFPREGVKQGSTSMVSHPSQANKRLWPSYVISTYGRKSSTCAVGGIPQDVWAIWEAELKRTLCSPLLRREWATLRNEFLAYIEFIEYVESFQAQSAKAVS